MTLATAVCVRQSVLRNRVLFALLCVYSDISTNAAPAVRVMLAIHVLLTCWCINKYSATLYAPARPRGKSVPYMACAQGR